ncbi:hypothetical protein LWI29_014405 [Acer saccharum]|uniref:Uncharacterized protein n=1 Tax=Acer saccharum TaxID=4024 RepID=A0AA39TEA5_ACESA|nr:hypothetical protein LWI29_014405 [Acer saccharum]
MFGDLEKPPDDQKWSVLTQTWDDKGDLVWANGIRDGCRPWNEVDTKIALCAGGPALDDRRWTSAQAHFCKGAGRHALTQAPDQRSTTGLLALVWTSARPAARHWAFCAGQALVDQRTATIFEPHK